MTSNARADRRRRLLHDGAGAGASPDTQDRSDSPVTRYAPKGGSASYAIASRLLPHSRAAIAAAFGALASILVGLVALDVVSDPASGMPVNQLSLRGSASLASWWTATLWLSAAATAAVVFGLRRSRMDDLRCGYRWWAVGAVAGVAMSVNAATGAHAWVAAHLAQASGFSPFPNHSFWWLLPGVVALGFLAIRLIVDASESGGAVFFGGVALFVTTIGWGSDAGLIPESVRALSPWLGASVLGPAATIAGLSFAVCSMFCLARRIVRDAQGAVFSSAPRAEKKRSKPAAKAREVAVKKTAPATQSKEETRKEARKPAPRKKEKVEEATAWVGGGDDYSDEYEEQPQRRRLSKAERKRLRKQKARRAA